MNLEQWMNEGKYLPDFFRDFHDQKNIFKCMHQKYESDENENKLDDMPNFVNGMIYTVDWFLWYMGRRGYTLQKNRTKNIEFEEFEQFKPNISLGDILKSIMDDKD